MANKISAETVLKIEKKSPKALPTRPSDDGYTAEEIRQHGYRFVTDAADSVISEINRIVDEVNEDVSAVNGDLAAHADNTSNPHGVTKAQVGLGNVDNTSDLNKPISTAVWAALGYKLSFDDVIYGLESAAVNKPLAAACGKELADAIDEHKADEDAHATLFAGKADATDLTAHTGNTSNPHGVTKAQVGLGNADNTSDADKPLSTAATAALAGKADLVDGKVPAAQLPSFVDDVLEYADADAFPSTGETGKIYVAKDTNKTYRWSGSVFVEISPSLALGETSGTAYRGDRGAAAYDHITDAAAHAALFGTKADATDLTAHTGNTSNPHNVTAAQVGLGNVDNTSDASKPVSTAQAAAIAAAVAAAKNYRLINKYTTLSTDTGAVEFYEDGDGESFELTDVVITMKNPAAAQADKVVKILLNDKTAAVISRDAQQNAGIYTMFEINSSPVWHFMAWGADKRDGGANGNWTAGAITGMCRTAIDTETYITSVSLGIANNNFAPDTEITLYGKDR